MTGPKGALAHRLVTEVFPDFPDMRFVVVGEPVGETLRSAAKPNVSFRGWIYDLPGFFAGVDLVIGSGRVALEAMQSGVPVLAVGEARHIGFIDSETFEEARRTNFGDCDLNAGPDIGAVVRDLARFAAGFRPNTAHYPDWLRGYSWDRVAPNVEKLYREALLERRLTGIRGVPILCYHRVVARVPEGSRANIHVTRETLASHLEMLNRRGRQSITFSDLLGDKPLPRRPVILTFDDGYRDNHQHLLPLLDTYGHRAVVFALGNRKLRENTWDIAEGEPRVALMSDAELRACCASGLVEIGAHGLNHRRLPGLPGPDVDEEIRGSKAALEDLLAVPVCAFAYPYGEWSKRESECVASAGFSFGIATDRGKPLDVDRFAAGRRLIFPTTDRFGFWKKTSKWYPRYRHIVGRTA